MIALPENVGPDLNPVEILELAMRQFGGRCGLTPVA